MGDEVTGKVNRTAAYGVFVDLENNIRGLLHVDEVTIAEGDSSREPNLRAMFSEGEEIKVRLGRPQESASLCRPSMSPCYFLMVAGGHYVRFNRPEQSLHLGVDCVRSTLHVGLSLMRVSHAPWTGGGWMWGKLGMQ